MFSKGIGFNVCLPQPPSQIKDLAAPEPPSFCRRQTFGLTGGRNLSGIDLEGLLEVNRIHKSNEELELGDFEHGNELLGKIHGEANFNKVFCHFTGFLEGIASSGYIETGELEPLIAESLEFLEKFEDVDANDVIQDFQAEVLEHSMIADAVEMRVAEIDPDCEKSGINRFLGFCRGVVCDGIVTVEEANAILAKIQQNPKFLEVVGVKQIQLVCIDAVEDGIVDDHESYSICEAISMIVGDSYGDTGIAQTSGVANFNEFRLNDLWIDLEGRTVVLTGNFKEKPRSRFEERLADFGAIVTGHVSGKTDFIIIGGEASRDWIEMHRGTKMKKAQEILLKSDNPKFISESQILRLISNAPH